MVLSRLSFAATVISSLLVPPQFALADEAALPAELDGLSLVAAGQEQVSSVEAGGVLLLADGRRVRLAGIELPGRPLDISADEPWPIADESRAVLAALVARGPVRLLREHRATDRYGRILAQAIAADGNWVQGALLRQGWARVATNPDSRGAAPALLAAEATAREYHLGLWAMPAYRPRSPSETPRLVDTVQVVEGRVANAEMIKGELHLIFGRDRRRTLTIRIPRPVLAGFGGYPPLAAFAATPEGLAGHRLRVRGWIGKGAGPLLDLSHPEQLELVDETHYAGGKDRPWRGQREEE